MTLFQKDDFITEVQTYLTECLEPAESTEPIETISIEKSPKNKKTRTLL